MSAEIIPLPITIAAVTLISADATRYPEIDLTDKRRRSLAFSINAMEVDQNGHWDVRTEYAVELLNDDDDIMAELRSEYLTSFEFDGSDTPAPDPELIGRIQLAVAEATHPYHRNLLIQLSDQFDLPAYHLPFMFQRDKFAAQLRTELDEMRADKSDGADELQGGSGEGQPAEQTPDEVTEVRRGRRAPRR